VLKDKPSENKTSGEPEASKSVPIEYRTSDYEVRRLQKLGGKTR